MAKQVLRRWSNYFECTYGSQLPEDYLCFDCETTGLVRATDLPLEIGHTIVRGGVAINQGSMVLDWTSDSRVDQNWLRQRLHETRRSMLARGAAYRFTPEVLRAEGRPPNEVLGFYHKLFTTNRKAGAFFVGQNAIFFDVFLLEDCFRQFLGNRFEFGENEVFDTGTMEKACIIGELPRPNETLRQYFLRIKYIRAGGVLWNLTACAGRYGLPQKHQLDMRLTHTAKFDSYVCHLLFEQHR